MKLIVDIPDKTYESISRCGVIDIPLGFAIKNGTPLKEWLSSFNTDSAPICFNKIQELKRECEKE